MKLSSYWPLVLSFVLLLALSLAGCGESRRPESIAETNNPDYRVTRLFTVDGVTVYGFWDGGGYHYFASRPGSVSYQVPSGKTSRPESIDTN